MKRFVDSNHQICETEFVHKESLKSTVSDRSTETRSWISPEKEMEGDA